MQNSYKNSADNSAHYYSRNPSSESRRDVIIYELNRSKLEFYTDSGVFSKRRVDFGTDLLIRSLPPLSGKILDLGCGYGVAGISAALLNPGADVWFIDVNERAIGLCRENYARLAAGLKTGTDNRFLCSDGFTEYGGSSFDAIMTNPPVRTGKTNVFRLYAEAYGRLRVGGAFFVVIQKKQGMESTRAELLRLYGNCADIARKSGYHVLQATRVA